MLKTCLKLNKSLNKALINLKISINRNIKFLGYISNINILNCWFNLKN